MQHSLTRTLTILLWKRKSEDTMVGGPIFIEMVPKMDNIINLAGLWVVGGNMGGAESPRQTQRYSCCAAPRPRPGPGHWIFFPSPRYHHLTIHSVFTAARSANDGKGPLPCQCLGIVCSAIMPLIVTQQATRTREGQCGAISFEN